jgi:ABC-type glycerol-3-phosphate transport system substrate-binding protein
MSRTPLHRSLAAVLLVTLTASLSTACGSSNDAKPSADKPYAGQTITLETISAVPEFDFYKTLMPQFTSRTGIKVNYVQLPVAGIDQKLPLQLKAKDKGVDVFTTGSENIGSFIGNDGVMPLDDFLNDPKQTPSSYDFADIAPAVQSACQQGGKNYCIASHTGGSLLYYNTKMFQEAGITRPPQTPAELYEDAQKLTNDQHAGFCVRGDKSQALYDAFQLWNWFIPWNNPVTGNYFDKQWNFLLGTEPQASQFGNFYRNMLQKTAPKGIGTYLVTNCLQDFQQGRVAMWHDDSGTIPSVLDPTKSRVAGDTAFWEMPCPPVNPDHCALVQPFGVWMNKASTKQGAAWQLIQFLTSAETQRAVVKAKALLTPSRNSVIKDPATAATLPKTFPEALSYILAHANVTLLPFIPEGVAIIPPIANGLSDLATSNKPVGSVMATMTDGTNTIMKQAGYPKPFPSS